MPHLVGSECGFIGRAFHLVPHRVGPFFGVDDPAILKYFKIGDVIFAPTRSINFVVRRKDHMPDILRQNYQRNQKHCREPNTSHHATSILLRIIIFKINCDSRRNTGLNHFVCRHPLGSCSRTTPLFQVGQARICPYRNLNRYPPVSSFPFLGIVWFHVCLCQFRKRERLRSMSCCVWQNKTLTRMTCCAPSWMGRYRPRMPAWPLNLRWAYCAGRGFWIS